MKKTVWKRAGAFLIAGILSLSLLSGCGGGSSDPASILEDVAEAVEDVKSVRQNYLLSVEMEAADESVTVSLDMESDITASPLAAHAEGSVGAAMSGVDVSFDMETYATEDTVYLGYNLGTESWTYGEPPYDYEDNVIINIDELSKNADNLELEDTSAESQGEDCVLLSGEVALEDFSDIWHCVGTAGMDLTYMLENMGAAEDEAIPFELYIYRDNQLPAEITFDMAKLAENAASDAGSDADVSNFFVTLSYTDYGDADDIELPSEVEEDAHTGDADIFEAMFGGSSSSSLDDAEDEDEDVIGGADDGTEIVVAEQSEDLGDAWTDYTIQLNDTVLTLPCTYEDIINAGFAPDEDTDPETVVNKEDTEYGYFTVGEDTYSYISVTFYNPSTEEAKAITESLVTRISVDEYVVEDGLSVILPGGITFASTREEIIAAYGEPNDTYEGETFDYLTYYDGDSYFNSLEFSIHKEDNGIYDIALSRQE